MAILGYKKSSLFIRDFGLDEWLRTRGLAGWLEIATDGLEAPAKQRITHEIEGHYAEAVGHHMAAGEPELSAQMTALNELGDPKVAAANFQKSHLTELEEKAMRRMERMAAKPFFSGWAALIDGLPLVGAVFLFSYAHQHTLRLDSVILSCLALVSYIGLRLIPRLVFARASQNLARSKYLALCEFATEAVVLPGIWLVPLMEHRDGFSVFNAVFIFSLNYAFSPGFRIWKKLRKMGNKRSEMPPWQTPVS